METVHVELPDEGEEVVVFEVPGEDLGGQSVDVFDNKGLPSRQPFDDVFVLRVLSQGRGTSTIR